LRRSSQRRFRAKILRVSKPSLFSTSYHYMQREMIYFFSFLNIAYVLTTPVPAQPVKAKAIQTVSAPAPSASGIVTELESLYLKGEAIRATFSLGSEKQIQLLVALRSSKYKLETSQEMVVNDGTLVHRLNKARNEVVLDYTRKKNATNSSPVDLFNFSSNYSATLVSSGTNRYTLELTPKPSVEELYKQAEIKSLVFELKRSAKGKPLQVVSVTANGKGTKRKVTNVSIKPVATLTANAFDFHSPKDAKIIDLTEE
jgi:outer membrane lipoprotein-sorting protein